MANISYNDFENNETVVSWFLVSGDENNYIQRVLLDGGTMEAESCFFESIESLQGQDYSFKCGGKPPLVYRWHGKKYDPVRGSEITFKVMIQNQADRDEITKLLGNSYFVQVRKYGKVQWFGKMFPQFYVEPYRQFPYVIDLNAGDQLGQLKEVQFLMVDFPEPYNYESPLYSILKFVSTALTTPDFYPGGAMQPAPNILRTNTRLYHEGLIQEFYENTFIDPLVFMQEEEIDEYLSKRECLEKLLEPLHVRLFQYGGIWHLMAIDAQYNAGNYEYEDYLIEYENQTLIRSGKYFEPILDLYENKLTNYPETAQVYNNALLSFDPAWKKVVATENFIQNKNIIPAFANRSGNFYSGQDGIALEIEQEYDPERFNLRNWTDNLMRFEPYPGENDGWIILDNGTGLNEFFGAYIDFDLQHITSIINEPISSYNFNIELNGYWGVAPEGLIDTPYYTLRIDIVVYSGGVPKFLNNEKEDDIGQYELKWYDEYRSFYYKVSMADVPQSVSFNIPPPWTDNTGQSFRIYLYQPFASGAWPFVKGVLKALRLGVNNDQFNASQRITKTLIINPLGTEPVIKKNFSWGIKHPAINNNHNFHLSGYYNSTGGFINTLLKQGEGDDWFLYDTPVNFLLKQYGADNQVYTKRLKGTWKSRQITPFTLVYDYERNIYQFVSGEFDDQMGTWSNEYIEFKAIRNLPGQLQKCSFSDLDFNNDFCKFTTPEASAFYERVTIDGGTVEALSCLNSVIVWLYEQ